MAIAKFNKDYYMNREGGIVLLYQFNEAWPFSIASTPVNYQGGSVLKLNVTFRYTRYFVYDVTTVGISTGPFHVGPIIAAPTATGVGDIKVLSISLRLTPGDEGKFAILFFRFLFCYKYSIF